MKKAEQGWSSDNARVGAFVGDKIYEMTPELLRSLGMEGSKKK